MSLFQTSQIGRVRLHVWPTKRFKTFAISLFAGVPLQEETVTETALIPFVLRRGNSKYPETAAFRAKLDDMYGAGFGFDVYKRGGYQIVQFRMDVIHDQFVSSEQPLLASSLSFLGDTVTRPYLENDMFSSAYTTAEKDTLRNRLEAIVNDKIRYAAERCIEEMCAGEAYRLHPLGERDKIAAITPASLYERYKAWMQEAAFDLYIAGDTTMEEAAAYVEQYFAIDTGAPSLYSGTLLQGGDGEVKYHTEELDVGQGKLNMGLQTRIGYTDPKYPALLMYNGILGGYPHSKLFINVREKESLAYYAASRLDGHKGICTIQSGIEIENYDKALVIILEQLEAMRSGQLTQLEMDQTKAMLTNQLREMQDSAFEMCAYHFNSVFSGTDRSVDQLLEAVKLVTTEAVKEVAQFVRLDTVYFLRNKKEAK